MIVTMFEGSAVCRWRVLSEMLLIAFETMLGSWCVSGGGAALRVTWQIKDGVRMTSRRLTKMRKKWMTGHCGASCLCGSRMAGAERGMRCDDDREDGSR